MKKVVVLMMIGLFACSAFAVAPVNRTAKLLPPNTFVVSGYTSNSFTTFGIDFSYAFKKVEVGAKVNLHSFGFNLELMGRMHFWEFEGIDFGFFYGVHLLGSNLSRRIELAANPILNISYELNDNISFYGGLKYKIGYGSTSFSTFLINRLNLIAGTEIEIIDNLNLFIEFQPLIFSRTILDGNTAFLGINYYFGKGKVSETPGA